MALSLQWKGDPLPHHIETVETAYRDYDFVSHALQRLSTTPNLPAPQNLTIAPLATGGAMAVYKLTATWSQVHKQYIVCKIPLERQLVYTSANHDTAIETTAQLLDRLRSLSDDLHQKTPGLFPRSGGVWHWMTADAKERHLYVEEFIPGRSLERLRDDCEQDWSNGQLSIDTYRQRRLCIERLAVATFTRLWDALDRRVFTSDPSPWNVLAPQHRDTDDVPRDATIIDLHSLEEEAGLSYVLQRLAAVYGLRQEVLDHALLPGIIDILGSDEGRTLLQAELPALEAAAEKAAKNLGVNLLQPLLKAIRAL